MKTHHGVTLIKTGPRFDEKTTFELGPIKIHPPIDFPQMYVLLVCMLGGNTHTVKTLHAAGAELSCYLAEDYVDLGKKHDLVLCRPMADGEIQFIVARPEDEKSTEH